VFYLLSNRKRKQKKTKNYSGSKTKNELLLSQTEKYIYKEKEL
jgi:hypothetical protein